jgi:hypothetical protein
MLMTKCKVTYRNVARKATYGDDKAVIKTIAVIDTEEEYQGNVLKGDIAERIRNGEIKEIVITLE